MDSSINIEITKKKKPYPPNRLTWAVLLFLLMGFSLESYSQVDTDFWFVVPEISHRGSTGGKPGTLRFATLELEATVTIEMPANPAFTTIVLDIPAVIGYADQVGFGTARWVD